MASATKVCAFFLPRGCKRNALKHLLIKLPRPETSIIPRFNQGQDKTRLGSTPTARSGGFHSEAGPGPMT
eukprot:747859-Hanusia_phi.AAC.1